MKLKMYQVDAFANHRFEGNPAAVCLLDHWLPEEVMQSIAQENNLSETAFIVNNGSGFDIRWFTPVHEVDLCGHATLAAAKVLLQQGPSAMMSFESRSGTLTVAQRDQWLEMDFPAQMPAACSTPRTISEAFGETPKQCLKGEDYIVEFESAETVLKVRPSLEKLKQLDLRGVAITARSNEYDFVTRFFAPKYGLNEDPVTGSAFTQLAPYWAGVLNKSALRARQVSQRGGDVCCEVTGNRVKIAGKAVVYLKGTIEI
ncbi:PhzF family phenazine biosynthesis protein [Marinobacter panjinensis]|uniref:PhzF family phenazine biosynthesis protein n=1 Tax=Marinobacter panjinensis TaxID=2576384 RepID=A0A4U6QZX9_9GAMM|nr:PhzF family phenazine biosynthesis protein [Marinobacter panjinensis]MCR8915416.1 PhzF family phenazine biosynthesis protein [Marinobacter panjinensis]TKV66673.1 PhzF family phenazine biosynthesis protein [Marinobacter panjinensis]